MTGLPYLRTEGAWLYIFDDLTGRCFKVRRQQTGAQALDCGAPRASRACRIEPCWCRRALSPDEEKVSSVA